MENVDCEYFVDDMEVMGVAETEHKYIKDRADIRIKRILPYVKDRVVLDMGCGSGYATYEYGKVAKYITGLDIDKDAIKYAQKHYPNVRFVCKDCLDGLDGLFDVIVCTVMMEHLPNEEWDKLLTNVYNSLKEGGLFVGTMPVEGTTEEWRHHKARYDKDVFYRFTPYFKQGLVSKLVFPHYCPSYFFRFIKRDKKNG